MPTRPYSAAIIGGLWPSTSPDAWSDVGDDLAKKADSLDAGASDIRRLADGLPAENSGKTIDAMYEMCHRQAVAVIKQATIYHSMAKGVSEIARLIYSARSKLDEIDERANEEIEQIRQQAQAQARLGSSVAVYAAAKQAIAAVIAQARAEALAESTTGRWRNHKPGQQNGRRNGRPTGQRSNPIESQRFSQRLRRRTRPGPARHARKPPTSPTRARQPAGARSDQHLGRNTRRHTAATEDSTEAPNPLLRPRRWRHREQAGRPPERAISLRQAVEPERPDTSYRYGGHEWHDRPVAADWRPADGAAVDGYAVGWLGRGIGCWWVVAVGGDARFVGVVSDVGAELERAVDPIDE